MVVVDGVEYWYTGIGGREVAAFENQNGDVIRGRMPFRAMMPAMQNLTGLAGAVG